jgi:hypothetical protein
VRVLVACECSGRVRDAFRARGHDAWSCDLQPADDGSPYHIQGDVMDVISDGWDLMIAHPPCTDLAVSGAAWFAAKRADGRQQRAIEFFMQMIDAPVPRIAVENPVGIMSTLYRKPDQVIHPWQFGHTEQKATCLWLKNLPRLAPTAYVYGAMMRLPKNERERLHYLPPSPDRAKLRSVTFDGIAEAMAARWSDDLPAIQPMLGLFAEEGAS